MLTMLKLQKPVYQLFSVKFEIKESEIEAKTKQTIFFLKGKTMKYIQK